ncbi:peptidase C1 [Bacillus cereus]|nr:peptidase C1 [Bacillus cereus]
MSNDTISLEEIKSALSSSDALWKAEETILSSLSFEEKKFYLGAQPPPSEPSVEEIEKRVSLTKESLKAEALNTIGVPTAYDLRNVDNLNFVTAVKDQKQCRSCVAFGTIATVESSLLVQQRNDPRLNLEVDLSEAHLFFCHAGSPCSGGWWPPSAYDAFKNKGVVDEACYKYDVGLERQDCNGMCADPNNHVVKIIGYTDLTGKPVQIKEWIFSKGPVSACLLVYEDFYSYRSGIYKHVTGQSLGAHCVTIIGYNDDHGYWICKNSWGQEWGEQGFFRIAYGEYGIDYYSNHGVDCGVTVPDWETKEEVERGDDMGVSTPNAESIGLQVEYNFLQHEPGFAHEDIVQIEPAPGSLLSKGSTVRVFVNLEG